MIRSLTRLLVIAGTVAGLTALAACQADPGAVVGLEGRGSLCDTSRAHVDTIGWMYDQPILVYDCNRRRT